MSDANQRIDIKGLDKAAILAALHNHTHAIGYGHIQDLHRDLTVTEAAGIIAKREMLGPSQYRFDYICGRPIKADLDGNDFDPRLFDRDAGEGQAQRAIDSVRLTHGDQ